ncbi:MAG: hypothetical protein IJ960_00735 [Oscillospiraceae bacterium]|nr:hypothetical protein [Oscillospiraceae bacterium]
MEKTYTALAAVRDRRGEPCAVLVQADVNVGDVIRFTRANVPSLGLVHELLPVDEAGNTENFIGFLLGEVPTAERAWGPKTE